MDKNIQPIERFDHDYEQSEMRLHDTGEFVRYQDHVRAIRDTKYSLDICTNALSFAEKERDHYRSRCQELENELRRVQQPSVEDERELPPLPNPGMHAISWSCSAPGEYYTAEQMREYALAARATLSPQSNSAEFDGIKKPSVEDEKTNFTAWALDSAPKDTHIESAYRGWMAHAALPPAAGQDNSIILALQAVEDDDIQREIQKLRWFVASGTMARGNLTERLTFLPEQGRYKEFVAVAIVLATLNDNYATSTAGQEALQEILTTLDGLEKLLHQARSAYHNSEMWHEEGPFSDGPTFEYLINLSFNNARKQINYAILNTSKVQQAIPERRFPMQCGPSIPWSLAEVIYASYSAEYGTTQSLEKLAERGGFSWSEVEAIYKSRKREK